MDAADMRSPATSASARRGRQEPMDRNPVTPEAMGRSPVTQGATGRNPVTQGATGRNPVTQGATGRNPVTPTAMDPSRALSTERRATMRHLP